MLPTRVVALGTGVPLAGLLVVSGLVRAADPPPPRQPIDFFHRIHSGERHINCLFCHRTAQSADFAGMPSARLCMICHRVVIPEFTEIWKLRSYWEMGAPIPWERVNKLPAHVFFSHRAHTVTARLGCDVCHGQVEQYDRLQQAVPLTMGWCLQCHRAAKASVECWSCHR